ncbi:type II toxin-antitoxin system Phd/YefM family antitoxin [Aeromonas caviae]
MSYQSLAATTANITELRRNPMGTIKEGKGDAVAILYRNEPAFYCVPPELYAYYLELAEDAELNRIVEALLIKSKVGYSLPNPPGGLS